MKNNPIIIVAGEPNSIFLEIFFKTIKRNKFRSHNFDLFLGDEASYEKIKF